MSVKPRHKRSFKKKITGYFFLLIVLGFASFYFYSIISSKNPLFISPLGKQNLNTQSVEKLLKSNKILFSSVSLSGLTYIIKLQSNTEVKLSSQKDIGRQISSLQRILRELTIVGKPFKGIDFRFNEPIISF